MRRSRLLAAIVAFTILALSIPSLAAAATPELRGTGVRPKAFLKADLKSGLSPEVSAVKREASLKGGVARLSRSYPNVWWGSLRHADHRGELPGGIGTVVGDWHLSNFAHVEVEPGHTIYGYADFANAGRGPVAADALRGFMDMRIERGYSRDIVAGAIDSYVSALENIRSDPNWKPKPPTALAAPNWKTLAESKLTTLTKDGKFNVNDNPYPGIALTKPTSEEDKEVRALAEKGGPLGDFEIQDVAKYARIKGSTAGFTRYWVLAKRAGQPTILDLDEAIVPAPAALHKQVPLAARLKASQEDLWGVVTKDNYFAIKLNGHGFIVRDALRTSIPDIDERDLPEVVAYQAQLMASTHAGGWGSEKPEFIRDWLKVNSKIEAKHWARVTDKLEHQDK